jgi:hypothetical protein
METNSPTLECDDATSTDSRFSCLHVVTRENASGAPSRPRDQGSSDAVSSSVDASGADEMSEPRDEAVAALPAHHVFLSNTPSVLAMLSFLSSSSSSCSSVQSESAGYRCLRHDEASTEWQDTAPRTPSNGGDADGHSVWSRPLREAEPAPRGGEGPRTARVTCGAANTSRSPGHGRNSEFRTEHTRYSEPEHHRRREARRRVFVVSCRVSSM